MILLRALHGFARPPLCALVCALSAAAALFVCTPVAAGEWHAPNAVGVRCEDGFQYSWLPDIDAYSMCDAFIEQIGGTDPMSFYYNLVGAAPSFNYGDWTETCVACGGVDSVDFYLLDTHGGLNDGGATADFAMWDDNSRVNSVDMRLGELGEQVKIFAIYACDTLYTADGGLWNRWGTALSGGLKLLLGAHGLVYDGNSQKGTEFAGRIQNGEPVGQSWLEAVWYADNDNTPSVVNTGADANDCFGRMGVNLPSLPYEPALRDWQIGYVCWAGWNGS